MSAIPLTVFLSLGLAALFTFLFWREHRRRGLGGPERESLLPLADEVPRTVPGAPERNQPPGHGHGHAPDHAHGSAADDDACGCRTGLRPPCVGCLRVGARGSS